MFMAYEDGQHAQRIRIEGPPAMGKSTLCRKIAYDWACGELKQYKLLFFLEMRHVTGSEVIDEIFTQLLPKDFSITKEELANIISQHDKSTLFLFDGLDEITEDTIEGSDIADHIAKKLRVYCTIVITTRPRLCDRYLSDCDLYLIVKGFTKLSTDEYIDKYFKNDKDTGKALKQQIKFKGKMSLRNLSQISFVTPCMFLSCAFFGKIMKKNKREIISKEPYRINSEVLECTLKRYCAKLCIKLYSGEIPKSVIDYRDKLAIDSYKIYSADKINFLKTDISCEKYLDLGLLVRDLGHSRIKANELYFFYHKTWLEFFTAFYISSHLKLGDTTGLDSLFSNPKESSSVLKFLAGISESKPGGLLFVRFNQEIQTLENEFDTTTEYIDGSEKLSSLFGQCFECLHESKHGQESVSHVQRSIQGILLYSRVKTELSKCDSLCDSPDHEVCKFIRVNRPHCHFSFIVHFMKLQPGHIEVLRMYQPTMKEMSMLSNILSDTENNVMLKTLEIDMWQSKSQNIVPYVNHLSKFIRTFKANATLQTLNIHFTDNG
ncbi:NACHT, LRR and PYD domains-containing protein 3-like isoform X1 [Ptychodera flava]|uniref:NACHT, LRR and PYD domains-containing protein 3-like isoform X1 n=1 Tax=Ptychodera flava TaxID=63121 RepID=UPI00396A1FC6